MDNNLPDRAGVVAPPPLIYAAGLAAGLLLQRVAPIPGLPRRVARVLGFALIAISFLPGGSAFVTMRRARTGVNPVNPTTTIVTGGPFRYTRNPIYLSFTILYTGIALAADAAWALLLLPAVLLGVRRGVIDREERYLERKFGAAYTEYKARVRRWV